MLYNVDTNKPDNVLVIEIECAVFDSSWLTSNNPKPCIIYSALTTDSSLDVYANFAIKIHNPIRR